MSLGVVRSGVFLEEELSSVRSGGGFLNARPIKGLLLGLSVPAIVTRLVGVLCGVMSHVCVNRVPKRNDLTLANIKIYVPVVVVISTFTTLIDSNNTPETSVCVKGRSGGSTRGVLNGYFVLRVVVSIVLATVLLV